MKKGFTLIELLSVIIILGVIFIFIFPKLSSLINRSKEKNKEIIENRIIEATKEYAIRYNPRLDKKLINEGDNYVVAGKRLVDSGLIDQSDIDELENFSRVKCTLDEYENVNCEIMYKPVYECTYDGELIVGAEYVNGQYTYHYKQYYNGSAWANSAIDGWGVKLTDLTSTDPVTSKLCTKISGKPINSLQSMFYGSEATSIDLSSFDTSNVVRIQHMFYQSKALELDLSGFDTSKVTSMLRMFNESKATKINIGDFDTSKVTNMSFMFYQSPATELDVSSFDMSKVTNMNGMFQSTAATEIILPEKWSTGANATMVSSFQGAKVRELDFSGFDSSKVKSFQNVFRDSSLTLIKGIENLNTSNATNMAYMFSGTSVVELDLQGFNTSQVTTMEGMFNRCKQLKRLNLSSFNTTLVTLMNTPAYYSYGGMFQECNSLMELDLSSFDTSLVTNTHNMFYKCANLKTIYVSNNFVTDQVTIDDTMFTGSTKLVGGNGTTYSSSHVDKEYARVDTASTPGYFTLKNTE